MCNSCKHRDGQTARLAPGLFLLAGQGCWPLEAAIEEATKAVENIGKRPSLLQGDGSEIEGHNHDKDFAMEHDNCGA